MKFFIDAPYIVLPFGSARLALIISVIYLSLLFILIRYGIKTNSFKVNLWPHSEISIGKRNKIIISIAGYAIYIVSCILMIPFLNCENILLKIADKYLEYEPIVYLSVFLFLFSSFLNKVNRERHIVASNRIFCYAIWLSTGLGVLTKQIDYTFWQNIVVLVCAFLVNFVLTFLEFESVTQVCNKRDNFDMIKYKPVEKAEELFPRHRLQAENLASKISSSSSEPFSICLSGKWGTGKTSVINGAIEILQSKGNGNYHFIRINALELDDKNAMLNYLMAQIKANLKSQGVYVGIDSEYKEFAASTVGSLTTDAVGKLLHYRFLNTDDYRQQKKHLEDVLERTYKNGKLVVIVDDIERCDKKVATDYLFLIKEVATIKCCVSIFVTDFDILNKIICDDKDFYESSEINKKTNFLDKFFNYTIDLREELPEDIFDFYDKSFTEEDEACWSIYKIVGMSPGTWYKTTISKLSAKIENEKKKLESRFMKDDEKLAVEKRTVFLQQQQRLFISRMQNPRNMVKFYNVFRDSAHRCYKLLFVGLDDSQEKEVRGYLEKRNIEQVIFVLTFIEVCMPDKYQRLLEEGAEYIEPPLYGVNVEDVEDVEDGLIHELVQGLIFGEYFDYKKPNGYLKEGIRDFINKFIDADGSLHTLVNPFNSLEEKWLDAIESNNVYVLEKDWLYIVQMILGKMPIITNGVTNEWRIENFSKLLDFAGEKVNQGKWNSDMVFRVFESENRLDRQFATGTGLLQMFWKWLKKNNTFSKPSTEYLSVLNLFSHNYSYYRIGPLYRLAHYLIPVENATNKTEHLQECMLDSDKPFEQNLLAFIEKFMEAIPEVSISGKDWYERYKNFTDIIVEYLKENDLIEYPDVSEEIEQMNDAAEEFLSLWEIIKWLQSDKEATLKVTTPILQDFDNIDQGIECLEKTLQAIITGNENSKDLSENFADFFRYLRDSDEVVLTEVQLKRLHQLVGDFAKQTGYSTLPYRRTLLQFSRSNQEEQT